MFEDEDAFASYSWLLAVALSFCICKTRNGHAFQIGVCSTVAEKPKTPRPSPFCAFSHFSQPIKAMLPTECGCEALLGRGLPAERLPDYIAICKMQTQIVICHKGACFR